jgi:pSer/pThr/pTyr-binding forkhead associated (FHA) protein
MEPPGALFCSECGAFMLDVEKTAPETMIQHPFAESWGKGEEPPLLGQDMNPTLDAENITFVIPGSGRRVRMALDKDIQIGRADPATDVRPELDLTSDGGADLGVSRAHATISPSDEGVVLIDRESTNGTVLNGYRIPAELPYPLHNGDELRFGQLLVHVFLE